jgi:hypothetical protein
MKIVVPFLIVGGVLAWGIFGGEPVQLRPGSKMPQQLSQISR